MKMCQEFSKSKIDQFMVLSDPYDPAILLTLEDDTDLLDLPAIDGTVLGCAVVIIIRHLKRDAHDTSLIKPLWMLCRTIIILWVC